MPLPILHSYAGYAIYRMSKPKGEGNNWKRIALLVFLANLADFDFFPGIFFGQMNRFHRGISHSLGVSLILGVVIGLFCVATRKSFLRNFLLSFSAYFSHVVLDFFGVAGNWMPIFWPLSMQRFNPPLYLFGNSDSFLRHEDGLGPFLASLLSPGAFKMIAFETATVFLIGSLVKVITELERRLRLKEALTMAGVAAFVFIWTLSW